MLSYVILMSMLEVHAQAVYIVQGPKDGIENFPDKNKSGMNEYKNPPEQAKEQNLSVAEGNGTNGAAESLTVDDNNMKIESNELTTKRKPTKKSSSDSMKSSPRGAKHEDLIPVPKEKITTSVQKNQSWFLRRAAAPCSNPHVSSKERGEVHVVGDSATALLPEVPDGVSETADGANDLEVETALEEAEPHANPAENVASSCEVRHVVELKTNKDVLEHTNSSIENGATPLHDTDNATETETITAPKESSQNVVTKYGRTDDVSSNSIERRDSDSVATFVNESVVNLSGNNRLKKQIDVLMKARAKLEGQLEVMSVESKKALQQRADLQVRAARDDWVQDKSFTKSIVIRVFGVK